MEKKDTQIGSNKKERLITFFKNRDFVDCTFKVENEEIKAHKLILACSSPVFEKMLFGDMAQDVIDICDISGEEFRQVIEYIYTDTVEFCSCTNAWNLFYAANKYLLDNLLKVCLLYIKDHLTMNTLVLSYEYAEMYDLYEVKVKCFDDMINFLDGVFFCDYHMKPTTLRQILKTILANRLEILAKVIKWTMVECEFRQLKVSATNVVEILKKENMINYFKRDCIDVTSYRKVDAGVVRDSLVLINDLLKWGDCPYDLRLMPSFPPRYCRLRKEFKISCRMDLHQNEEFSCNFSVSKDIIVFGYCLTTPMEPPETASLRKVHYEGIISVRICHSFGKQEDVVTPLSTFEFISYHSNEFYVKCKHLTVLKKNVLYTFKISLRNSNTKGPTPIHCYYMNNTLAADNPDTTITFFEVNGTIIKGISFYPA